MTLSLISTLHSLGNANSITSVTMSFMEGEVDKLALHIMRRAASRQHGKRFIVGIAGVPGSGKSTVAYPLAERLNAFLTHNLTASLRGAKALCIGVDGWHYSQSHLREMKDSEKMFARRGAHFTFDGASFVSFVQTLDSDSSSIPFPTFSHADKDPIPHGGVVRPEHQIIVIEGLYCFLGTQPWGDAGRRLDERVWVDVPREVARDRIIRRHFSEGVESTLEGARRRADESDCLNGDYIVEHSLTPTRVIRDGSNTNGTTMRQTSAHQPKWTSKDQVLKIDVDTLRIPQEPASIIVSP